MYNPVADKRATDAFDFKERHMDPSVAAATINQLATTKENLSSQELERLC
jgi:hypothetical protein